LDGAQVLIARQQ